MAGRGAERINPDGLQIQVDAQRSGVLLLKPRDLDRIEIRQQRVRQRAPGVVSAVEGRFIKRQRLIEPFADLPDHVTGHLEARLFAELFTFLRRERELPPFGLGQRAAQFFLLRGDALFLIGARIRASDWP